MPTGTLIAVAVTGACLGMVVRHQSRGTRRSARSGSESYLLAACLGSVASALVVGLIVGAGWAGVAAVALVLAIWPAPALWILDRAPVNVATRWLRSLLTRAGAASRRSLRTWPARLRGMSDGSLCYSWATSSRQLQGLLPEADRLAIVRNRAYLLDELERRDPQGFASWTADGLDLGLDPRRFINSRTDRGEMWHDDSH